MNQYTLPVCNFDGIVSSLLFAFVESTLCKLPRWYAPSVRLVVLVVLFDCIRYILLFICKYHKRV